MAFGCFVPGVLLGFIAAIKKPPFGGLMIEPAK
jgi:hypothetical protein